MRSGLSCIVAAIPYAAVLVGLYGLRSAWAAILLYHVGIFVALCVGGWRQALLRAANGWRRRIAVLLVAATSLGGVALYLLWPYVDATPAGLAQRLEEFGLGGGWSWGAFAVYYSTVHPFLEELFWRGGRPAGGPAFLWRDAAFAGYHVPVLWFFIDPLWIAVTFVILTAASLTWRISAHRLGGLGVPLVSHAAADVSIVAAVSFIIRAG
jgi:hypothetical protein